jgi:hypothetical protein
MWDTQCRLCQTLTVDRDDEDLMKLAQMRRIQRESILMRLLLQRRDESPNDRIYGRE